MSRDTLAGMRHGTLIEMHRKLLELTVFEYAVLARCSPHVVRNAEAGLSRLPIDSILRLGGFGMGVRRLSAAATGCERMQASTVTHDAWDDTPYDNHAAARWQVRCHAPMTLGAVGELLGVCRERIRQIEQIAMRKLRRQFGDELLAHWLGSVSAHGTMDEGRVLRVPHEDATGGLR